VVSERDRRPTFAGGGDGSREPGVRRRRRAVVAIVAIVGAYVLFRVRRTPGVKFHRLLAERDEIAVLMHPNPDPDAMSAALGVASLAEQLDVDATVQYPGQIRHQENRAFRTVLDLSWTRSNT